MNTNFTFAVPCLFGLEGLVGDELRRMKLENVRVEDRRAFFTGGLDAMAKANLRLRMGERVMILLGRFPARTFEALYQGVKALPLEDLIPKDGQFPVKGYSLDSQLHSVPDCQSIVKKAAVDRLGSKYGLSWLPETGAVYQIRFSIMKDLCEVFLDTSGASLHKRGYRAVGNDAPLHETLAAGMVLLTRYRGREYFWDPFCGSGTIPIEAALIAKNRAPGLNRTFAAMEYPWMPKAIWTQVREEARDKEFHGDYRIVGSDNDPACVSLSFANARKAGVSDIVTFKDGDATKLPLPTDSGIIVCNPPYGERMMEQASAQRLYAAMGRHLKFANNWKQFIITSEPEFEHYFGRRCDKKRKFYNGKIQCNYYMFTDSARKVKRGGKQR